MNGNQRIINRLNGEIASLKAERGTLFVYGLIVGYLIPIVCFLLTGGR